MKRLRLAYKTPITAFEGLTVRVKQDGSFDLLFHQVTDEEDTTVSADVVAAVHIPNQATWEQLTQLVEEQLTQAKQREA